MYTLKYSCDKVFICVVIFVFGINGGNSQSNFNFQSTKFSTIAITSGFVDKTLLIKELLENNKTSMIAAPPKFGKSTNLDMIKTFMEIEVDEHGNPKSRVNYSSQPVKDTDNFRLFDDNNLKISQETNIMNEYFGRTPVLSVSFKCDRNIKNFDDAVSYFKDVVHDTFKKYKFLLNSEKLSTGHKQYIESWCDPREYQMFGKQRVSSALRELAEYIYRHFNQRRVFVLIDDHDAAISSAMYSVTDDDVLDDIVRFSVCIMNAVLKSNSRYVLGGLMTGVMDIPAFGSPAHNLDDPDSFQIYRFLGNHRFVDFYGLTSKEVDELFVYPKLKLGENVVEKATEKYGGYTSIKGKEIFNLYSVLNFLQVGEFNVFWPTSCPLRNISVVAKIPFINKCLKALLKGSCLNITSIKEIASDDIALLRDFLLDSSTQREYLAKKYLFFLIEKGYLSYVSGMVSVTGDETEIAVRIPNDEIREYFSEAIKEGS